MTSPSGSGTAVAFAADPQLAPALQASPPGLTVTAALASALPPLGGFALAFPPNAWPLLRAEGTRGPNGLSLRIHADGRDAPRLRSALAALRAGLEASGHSVESVTVTTEDAS
jgi:hypothetical protein